MCRPCHLHPHALHEVTGRIFMIAKNQCGLPDINWEPDEGLGHVDLVTFSYSLTMIPDWFAAMDNANALLTGPHWV